MGTVQRTVRSAARRKKDNFQLCFLAITKTKRVRLVITSSCFPIFLLFVCVYLGGHVRRKERSFDYRNHWSGWILFGGTLAGKGLHGKCVLPRRYRYILLTLPADTGNDRIFPLRLPNSIPHKHLLTHSLTFLNLQLDRSMVSFAGHPASTRVVSNTFTAIVTTLELSSFCITETCVTLPT